MNPAAAFNARLAASKTRALALIDRLLELDLAAPDAPPAHLVRETRLNAAVVLRTTPLSPTLCDPDADTAPPPGRAARVTRPAPATEPFDGDELDSLADLAGLAGFDDLAGHADPDDVDDPDTRRRAAPITDPARVADAVERLARALSGPLSPGAVAAAFAPRTPAPAPNPTPTPPSAHAPPAPARATGAAALAAIAGLALSCTQAFAQPAVAPPPAPARTDAALWPAPEPVAAPRPTRADFGVMVPMRDGVRLSADILRPDAPGRFPVILDRTPYNKAAAGTSTVNRRKALVERGYVYVAMDCRGRGDSEGTFIPWRQEGPDGYDAIEWCADQPWSNGKVATIGGSYGGFNQWMAAVEQPPSLAAMVAFVSCPDPMIDGLHGGPTGLPSPICLSWYHYVSGHVNQQAKLIDWAEAFKRHPLIDLDDMAGRPNPVWDDIVRHSVLDSWYDVARYQNRLDRVTVPVLHVSGWYDDEQISTLINFRGMTSARIPERLRRDQRLLMGPWGHAVNAGTKFGPIEFGPGAKIDMDACVTRFLDAHVKGIGLEELRAEPPVRLFVMGENEWRDENAWPIERTEPTPFYLHSRGRANTAAGNGDLLRKPPAPSQPPDTFVYDPANPVPFITDPDFSQVGGADDYREIEKREDVLVYTSEPATRPIEFCGPVTAKIWAITDAPDTDFTARLLLVHPDGMSQRLCDGIVRARFREGMEKQVPITPGRPYLYEINCWNTCQTVKPGYRIRVQVSSSSSPQWDTNLNTGAPLGLTSEHRPARQTILHDAEHPSAIILPVVPPRR